MQWAAKVPDSAGAGKRGVCGVTERARARGRFSLIRPGGFAENAPMRHWLTIALVCLLAGSGGCFVIDEIDKGQEEMRKHSPEAKNQAKSAPEKDENGGISLAALRERSAGAIDSISGRVEEALAPEPDPDNVVVSCAIDGRTEFTRKFDCQSRGGQVLSR